MGLRRVRRLPLVMRVFLVPKMRKGMQARRDKIRTDLETADATRLAAHVEVEEYQAQLAAVRAEAAQRIDVARQQLESERAARLAEVNAGIAQRRSAAMAEADEAMAAGTPVDQRSPSVRSRHERSRWLSASDRGRTPCNAR